VRSALEEKERRHGEGEEAPVRRWLARLGRKGVAIGAAGGRRWP
jgi:hypothetical protein